MWAINFRTVSPDKNYDGHIFKLSDTNAVWTMLVYTPLLIKTAILYPISDQFGGEEKFTYSMQPPSIFPLSLSLILHQSNIQRLDKWTTTIPDMQFRFTISLARLFFFLPLSIFFLSLFGVNYTAWTSENSQQRLATRFLYTYVGTWIFFFCCVLFFTPSHSLFQYFYYILV